MIPDAEYGHTNLIARDWRSLSSFYQRVFGCDPVPPERDYSGPALEAGTGVKGSTVKGVHLRLPGHGPNGPALEISCTALPPTHCARRSTAPASGVSQSRYTDVRDAHREVLDAGGSALGEIVRLQTATGTRVTWCYVRDSEGDIIELQSWS